MTLRVSGVLTTGAAACLLWTLPAAAQFQGIGEIRDGDPSGVVRGEVTGAGRYPSGSLTVEFRRSDGFSATAEVSTSGTFQFRDLGQGTYQVAVMDQQGNALCRDLASIPTPVVVLHLPEAGPSSSGAGETVSLARLEHKVPDKAVKEFEKALAAKRKDDREGAMEHLERAVEIDPEFMEAYNNPGVQYMNQGDSEKALDAFDRAVKLDPGSAKAAANCGAALFNLKRFQEAALAARRAVELDGSLIRARYTLGLSLAATGERPDEAEHNLRMTVDQYPAARLALAQVLEAKGERRQAREQLETYLASGNAPHREKVEEWLKEIPE